MAEPLLAYTSDALGASSWLWRFQHNTLHHGNTNVVGVDADIALSPIARVAPTQRWHCWYRAQHVYIWPLYGFLALKNLLVSDIVALITRRVDQQPIRQHVRPAVVAQVIAGKVFHVAWAVLLPLAFNPWWAVVVFYLACSWLVGFLLAITFQLAHCVDLTAMQDATVPRRGDDFTAHQLATTAHFAAPLPVIGHLVRGWSAASITRSNTTLHRDCRTPSIPPSRPASVRRAPTTASPTTSTRVCGPLLRSHTRWLRVMSTPATSPVSAGGGQAGARSRPDNHRCPTEAASPTVRWVRGRRGRPACQRR